MDSGLRALRICLLALEFGDPSGTDLGEGSLDPFRNLLRIRVLGHWEGRCRENILHYLSSFLPYFWPRIKSELKDSHEGLAETLNIQVRPIKSMENGAI